MAKEIIDIWIEQGYEYGFNIDLNLYTGEDLEGDYNCFFENSSIGKKQFNVVNNTFILTLSEEDTTKVGSNLEEYVVYTEDKTTFKYDKLLSGRIHLDTKTKV